MYYLIYVNNIIKIYLFLYIVYKKIKIYLSVLAILKHKTRLNLYFWTNIFGKIIAKNGGIECKCEKIGLNLLQNQKNTTY